MLSSDNVFQIEEAFVRDLCPVRPEEGHKGTFGSVLLWAGSEKYSGAAHLCAMGALRSGVGLVHLLCPEQLLLFLSAAAPPLIGHALSSDKNASLLQEFYGKKKALVIGPGLPPEDEYLSEALFPSLENAENILLDAGALSFLAQNREKAKRAFSVRQANNLPKAILTPHPGEFSRLFPSASLEKREENAKEFSRENDCITILKGKNTIVSAPDGQVFINTTGNHGMAKGGSGDVLSGMIGSFLAQGLFPLAAACCGVYFHGLAGDMAAEKFGHRYMQPTDLPTFFPDAFRFCGWEE